MYPVSLDIKDKTCVIVGGGPVAQRKVLALLDAGGRVRVVSPAITPQLQELVRNHQITWCNRPYRSSDLADAFLVFAATNIPAVQEQVVADARKRHLLLNVVDKPQACTFQVPATVRRGSLTLAVTTEGKSPALAAMIRKQLEQHYPEAYGVLTDLMGHIRDRLDSGLDQQQRKILFQNILGADIVSWISKDQWTRIQAHLEQILGREITTAVMQALQRDP